MKKRKKGRSLSRTKDQREALLSTQLVSLAKYQSITTALAKAKELRPFAERMVTHAKLAANGDASLKVSKLRHMSRSIPTDAAKRLVEIAKLFKDRQGGYTRIVKLPVRKSDAAPMAIIEFVDKLEQEEKESKKSGKKEKNDSNKDKQ